MVMPSALRPLTPYAAVLQRLLSQLSPVAAEAVPLETAVGLIAEGTRTQAPLPGQGLARRDGYAVASQDLIGASALSPVMLLAAPPLVTSGAPLPPGTDAVLPHDLVEKRGPMVLALGEVLPGEGILPCGAWAAAQAWIAAPGLPITGAELMLAEEAGLSALACRVPRVVLLDVSGAPGPSARRVAEAVRRLGGLVEIHSAGRVADLALRADLLVTIGGTGQGEGDATAALIAEAGELFAHGVGFSAAPTLAAGWVEGRPVVALPGAPEAAVAGIFALLAPVLSRLCGREAAPSLTLPLARKVASQVGQAELLLLTREGQSWLPIPLGPLLPDAWRRADAWRMVGAGEEGWADGTPLAADLLERGLPK